MDREATTGVERRAASRARVRWTLKLHVAAFLMLNFAFWIIDVGLTSEGLDWALKVSLLWGLALVAHIVVYAAADRASYRDTVASGGVWPPERKRR
jgi:hypothetical protein